MDKTELDKGFEQALACLYHCRHIVLNRIQEDPESFSEYDANDYCDLLVKCM